MDPISQPGPAKARSKRWLLAAGIALGALLLWVGRRRCDPYGPGSVTRRGRAGVDGQAAG